MAAPLETRSPGCPRHASTSSKESIPREIFQSSVVTNKTSAATAWSAFAANEARSDELRRGVLGSGGLDVRGNSGIKTPETSRAHAWDASQGRAPHEMFPELLKTASEPAPLSCQDPASPRNEKAEQNLVAKPSPAPHLVSPRLLSSSHSSINALAQDNGSAMSNLLNQHAVVIHAMYPHEMSSEQFKAAYPSVRSADSTTNSATKDGSADTNRDNMTTLVKVNSMQAKAGNDHGNGNKHEHIITNTDENTVRDGGVLGHCDHSHNAQSMESLPEPELPYPEAAGRITYRVPELSSESMPALPLRSLPQYKNLTYQMAAFRNAQLSKELQKVPPPKYVCGVKEQPYQDPGHTGELPVAAYSDLKPLSNLLDPRNGTLGIEKLHCPSAGEGRTFTEFGDDDDKLPPAATFIMHELQPLASRWRWFAKRDVSATGEDTDKLALRRVDQQLSSEWDKRVNADCWKYEDHGNLLWAEEDVSYSKSRIKDIDFWMTVQFVNSVAAPYSWDMTTEGFRSGKLPSSGLAADYQEFPPDLAYVPIELHYGPINWSSIPGPKLNQPDYLNGKYFNQTSRFAMDKKTAEDKAKVKAAIVLKKTQNDKREQKREQRRAQRRASKEEKTIVPQDVGTSMGRMQDDRREEEHAQRRAAKDAQPMAAQNVDTSIDFIQDNKGQEKHAQHRASKQAKPISAQNVDTSLALTQDNPYRVNGKIHIRPHNGSDTEKTAMLRIYNYYVAHTIDAPETKKVTPKQFENMLARAVVEVYPTLLAVLRFPASDSPVAQGLAGSPQTPAESEFVEQIVGFSICKSWAGTEGIAFGDIACVQVHVSPEYTGRKIATNLVDRMLGCLDGDYRSKQGSTILVNSAGPVWNEGWRKPQTVVMRWFFRNKNEPRTQGRKQYLERHFGFIETGVLVDALSKDGGKTRYSMTTMQREANRSAAHQ